MSNPEPNDFRDQSFNLPTPAASNGTSALSGQARKQKGKEE